MSSHTDVVVVGAGPTGLMLAGDLAEAGVRVTVLERRARGVPELGGALLPMASKPSVVRE
jgi:2-polyprenyl-6-methoxyphenol hydroxylase-like FAD-dependent oxidoreductase